MLALLPTLLTLVAVSGVSADDSVRLMVRQNMPEACNSECTNFNKYYKACVADEKSADCLAVCQPAEWGPYQGCLNCIEKDQPGTSFKSTLEKVQQRCIDNGKGDPTGGAGIKSLAVPKQNVSSQASPSAAAPSTTPSSLAMDQFQVSGAGVAAAIVAGTVMLF